jgi:hypothetical protein
MNRAFPTVSKVRRLIEFGEVVIEPASFDELARVGVVHLLEDSGLAVLSRVGQRIVRMLPNELEALAAFFTCLEPLRVAWMRIIAARLREAGSRRDLLALCQQITLLSDASNKVRTLMPDFSLRPTPFRMFEAELLGEAAHHAAIYPTLLRSISATAWLINGIGSSKLPLIRPVDPLQPKVSWCGGRVIQLPRLNEDSLNATESRGTILENPHVLTASKLTYVLCGHCSALCDGELTPDDSPSQSLMRWVLYRPWCMLLAQVVFTLEAWSAEQISGQMALELAEDQISNPYEPKRVDVVVTTPDGSEILCGSLGQLMVRVLDRLQVTLLARDEEVERLDERLAGVIRLLLERKVWRFDPRGAGGSRPGYLIDDDFSTSCYRAFGSKYFYRAGSVLTAAIRSSAEQWASEKQAKSRELAGVER